MFLVGNFIIGWINLQIYYTWIFYHLYRHIHIFFHNSRYSIISIFHLFDHIAIRNYSLFLLGIALEYLAHRKIFELVYFLFESPNMAYHPNCSLRFYIVFLKKIIETKFSISTVLKAFSPNMSREIFFDYLVCVHRFQSSSFQ